MRIITGEYKGRRLFAPKDREIRPTTDRVKEAIFSMLSDKVYGNQVLDLFAGTGNLGLEALSRGSNHCYFADASKIALELLRKNINYCKAQEKSTILHGDYRRTLKQIIKPCNLIFLDPPYEKGMVLDCLSYIEEYEVLAPGGIIVIEHGKREVLSEEIGSFQLIKKRQYGTILISMYSCHCEVDYDTI